VPIRPAKSLLGARITLRTARGTLGYEVRNAFGVRKDRLGDIDSIMDPRVRDRVVLITCAELHGVDYDYNIVLDARLVSSRRA
jgi:sortase (surface protein transpeptidase)